MSLSIRLPVFALALMSGFCAIGQTVPDAGRILQELVVPPRPIPPSTGLQLQASTPLEEGALGGPKIELKVVQFHGMTRFDAEQLHAIVEPAVGQSHDLASLRRLVNRVTRFYRMQGYPFAHAYLPPQRIADGKLLIEIIEGQYDKATAVGETELAAQAQPFLSSLKPGDVIENEQLERTILILSDLPGLKLASTMKPGEKTGTGDLEVHVSRGRRIEAQLSVDNHGNRYTGSHRALAAVNWNSPFMLGDQISAGSMLTDEHLLFGQLAYALPLGVSGLRGQISYARTYYELGKEFANLAATGTANIATVGLSYPLIRSHSRNLILSLQYQHKDLEDKYGAVDVTNDKSSYTVPTTLQFDMRDGSVGGGITYGTLAWTPGRLALGTQDLRDQDRLTAKSEGSFQKLNLDISRLQRLQDNFSLFGRIVGQLANKNLDSSEAFSLGGVNGVRAYPQGEGYGSQGWLAQLEVRYSLDGFSAYAFYDAGATRINITPWAAGNNRRSISGIGTGLRVNLENMVIDGAIGWPRHGGDPESDSRRQESRLWLRVAFSM